jgi:hypothetical protein
MELLVDITSTAGRLTGTVRRPPSTTVHPFSGHLELMACLERLTTDPHGPDLAVQDPPRED